jgi:hypothetical protein
VCDELGRKGFSDKSVKGGRVMLKGSVRVALSVLLALALLGSPVSARAADRVTIAATGLNALDWDSIVAEDRGFFGNPLRHHRRCPGR